MLLPSDLPPPQFYIILGVIATACAIVSSDRERSKFRVVIAIVLVLATTVAAVPVVWPVAEEVFPEFASDVWKPTKLSIYILHLIALVTLCGLAIGTFIMQGFRGLRGRISRPFYFWRRRRLIRRYKSRLKKLESMTDRIRSMGDQPPP